MARPYIFVVHFDEGVIGRVWLNDLPLHKFMTRGPDSMSGGASHMLVSGTNTLAFEILRLTQRDKVPPVGFKIYQVKDASTTPTTIDPLLTLTLPAALSPVLEQPLQCPMYHAVRFTVPEPLPEPAYIEAPPVLFPCEGTPALRQAIAELHEAITNRDLVQFLELVRLKHEEYTRAYPGEPSATIDRQQAAATEFFALRTKTKPLDFARLHFEPRVGGRVAYVSGWDDEPAIISVAADEPNFALRTNILLTQHEGRWRVFG
jgi:hypothetical protein